MAENLDPEVIMRLNEEYLKQQESLRDSNLLAEAQNKAKKTEKNKKSGGRTRKRREKEKKNKKTIRTTFFERK